MRLIAEFPDYAVDGAGNVWRVVAQATGRRWKNKTVPYKLTPTAASGTGYLRVVLCKDGKQSMRAVHRLVCEAFHGSPEWRYACHNNGSRTDNRPENLRWDTQAGNVADTVRHGKVAKGAALPQTKLTRADVEWIRAYPKARGMFAAMSRRLQVSISTICDAYHHKYWNHDGEQA